MYSNKLLFVLFIILAMIANGCLVRSGQSQHDHESDHDLTDRQIAKVEVTEDHDTDEEGIIHLTSEAITKAGITTATVSHGYLTTSRKVYGEVQLNQDKTSDYFPRYPGVVRRVNFCVGDRVVSGDTLVTILNTETLQTYPIVAEISGEVVDKHAVTGELADGSESLLTISDLENVWVDLQAYEKDLSYFRRGDQLTIFSIDGLDSITTTVAYIKPIMDTNTRTTLVRSFISNSSGDWYPGKFVYAIVHKINKMNQVKLVPKTAVQRIGGEEFVFVPHEPGEYKLNAIQTGGSNAAFYEIRNGLKAGDVVVAQGAFELKSQLIMKSVTGHAGHGH